MKTLIQRRNSFCIACDGPQTYRLVTLSSRAVSHRSSMLSLPGEMQRCSLSLRGSYRVFDPSVKLAERNLYARANGGKALGFFPATTLFDAFCYRANGLPTRSGHLPICYARRSLPACNLCGLTSARGVVGGPKSLAQVVHGPVIGCAFRKRIFKARARHYWPLVDWDDLPRGN
jgi:hypothetical protein